MSTIDEEIFGIGRRFREERERLGYTQKGLATRLATTERTIVTYESDATPPKLAKLLLFTDCGADLLYILTGEHSSGIERILTPDEAALLDNYRNSSPQRQASLREVGFAFSEPKLATKKRPGS